MDTKTTWADVEKLAFWILKRRFRMHNAYEWIGEAYIAYDTALQTYDPTKGKFSVHYTWVLIGRITNLINYSDLVHIPLMKRDTHTHSYVGYDDPICDDSNMTIAETIAANPEDEDEDMVLYRTVLDLLADMRAIATPIQQKYWDILRDCIINDMPYPLEYRQQISRLNVRLKEKVKKVLES